MPDGPILHRLASFYEREYRDIAVRDVQTSRRVHLAINDDGSVNPEAFGSTVQFPIDFAIPGAAVVGTSVITPKRMPQTGQPVRIDAFAQTAPVGSEFTASLYADGTHVGSVTIQNGATSNSSPVSGAAITAGAVLTWNVTSIGDTTPAADIGLSLIYKPSS